MGRTIVRYSSHKGDGETANSAPGDPAKLSTPLPPSVVTEEMVQKYLRDVAGGQTVSEPRDAAELLPTGPVREITYVEW